MDPAVAAPGVTYVARTSSDDGQSRPDYYRYQAMAFPNDAIGVAESRQARAQWQALSASGGDGGPSWALVAPSTNSVPGIVTYTGLSTTVAGRVTALAISPGCGKGGAGDCLLWVGAAGGGVWRAENPDAPGVEWKWVSDGIGSTAIGSLAVDPNGKGKVLYAGTGEQNQSGDSEAGVGLFRSTDGGEHWSVVRSTVPLAEGLSISDIAIDPGNGRHYFFATARSLHGQAASASASVPPGSAIPGVYETKDGGATFQKIYESPPPGYVGALGVTQVVLDPRDPTTIYLASFGLGVLRSSPALDGDATFRTVFVSGPGIPNDGYNRAVIAIASLPKTTRIYLGDSIDWTGESMVYRVDDSRVPAASLSSGGANPGWLALSSPTAGTPGYGSYGFCQGQCWYDIFIGTPPGQPGTVWIGGSMNYDEIFGYVPPASNGRAVMRSTDAGATFTDMTNDARSPALGMHPDQHAIVFHPTNPGMAFVGSDGGVVRTDGVFVDRSTDCLTRPLAGADMVDCQTWLSSIPRRIDSLNQGLSTLQFQSVSLNPLDPLQEWMGGTQDNGTWAFGTKGASWFETIGGDGGQSGFDAVTPTTRVHTYYGPSPDVNFRGSDPMGWNWTADPLYASREGSAFYVPLINDPVLGGSIFIGLQHVWRTQDSGGPQAYLEQHCNEYTGDFLAPCGDWQPIGLKLTTDASFGNDNRAGGNIVALTRSQGDTGTLWAGTGRGRVFVARNADAASPVAVSFLRVDSLTATPRRGVSGIAVDPKDPGHAFVSFTGYGAYTPYAPGHVFEFRIPATGPVVVNDISYNIGDMPVTALVRDGKTGDLYAGTDFGVLHLAPGSHTWTSAGTALPPVAVYGLTLTPSGRALYAATHGRSVWRLDL
jgi:hypothetical protein